MQLGDLVSVYGGAGGGGRGGGNNIRGGRGGGGRGRGYHRGGGHHGHRGGGSSSWTPMPPPPAASQQPFIFGIAPPSQFAVQQPMGVASGASVLMPPPPLIVQPGMASHYYQRPKSGPPRPPKQKGKYGCETCDKYFETEALLRGHTDDHVPCEHAGCSFKALPKLVSAHGVVHTRAIPSLNTPEEIARYRAERRKHFPTDANVKRRQEEEDEKRKRGEIPEVAVNKRGRRGRGGRDNSFGSRYAGAPNREPPTLTPTAAAAAAAAVALPAALAALSAYPDSDNEAPAETSAKIPPPQPIVPEGPLEDGEIKTTQKRSSQHNTIQKRRCTFFLRGNCKKGVNCPFSHDPLPPRPRALSLLKKVYEKDIRREYSAALQCLRYIVQNNFLQ